MKLENERILVTGSEGFIGSHLTEELVKMGCKVTALVQYNSFNNWGWLDTLDNSIKKEIEVYTGDVREFDNVSKVVQGKSVVLHLAALIAIPYSYQSPAAYVRTNIEGTLHVMEACRIHEVKKVVHTSTSEVYGTARYVPIDEEHPLQGQSPYSASKIGADKMVESYHKSFGLPVATLRPFNTYGPRQSARAVIPTVISQILSGKETIRLGALSPKRDLTFVKDTAKGFIRAAEVDESIGQVINVGNNQEISIGDLAEKIIALTGRTVTIACDENRTRPANSEVNRLWCNNAKALDVLGWKPEYSLHEGLVETIDWIGRNLSFFKTDIYNV